MWRHSLKSGTRCLLSTSASKTPNQRTALGIKIAEEEDVSYVLKQEYANNPHFVRKMEGNKAAQRAFSVEFGDASDNFNRDLYDLYSKVLEYRPQTPLHSGYGEVGLDPAKDSNIKSVVVSHTKMAYLARKLPFDPHQLRGPQIKYHPHMEVVVRDKTQKNRVGREEIIWKKANYVRMKQAEFALTLGNRYDSYYTYKREIPQSKRFAYSRNNFFFRWVYYHGESSEPYELHGKVAAQMHRWSELKEERDAKLRAIELEDILKYRHVVNALGIKPVYIPTHKLPKPKWFRNNSISCLSEAEIGRLRNKRAHGAITPEEEENVTIPARATKFSELIPEWGAADQNVVLGSDFSFGQPVTIRDPVPLPQTDWELTSKKKLISDPAS